MISAETLIPLGVVVPVALWVGHRIVQATKAVTNLTRDLQDFRGELKLLADTKVGKREFSQWMERLGYKNPEVHVPHLPEQEKDAA